MTDAKTNNNNDKFQMLDEKSKQEFREFSRQKRQLTSPENISTPDGKRRNQLQRSQQSSRSSNYGKSLNFKSINNITFDPLPRPDDSIIIKSPLINSTISSNFESVNDSIDGNDENPFDLTEVNCDEFEKSLAQVSEMITNRADPHEILRKIADELAVTHKTYKESIAKINKNVFKRISAIHCQQIDSENRMIAKMSQIYQASTEHYNAIELSKVDNLLLKQRSQLLAEVKQIFKRMNIWINTPNRMIMDIYLQKVSVRENNSFGSEQLLAVKFLSSNVVVEIKKQISTFNKTLYAEKKFNSIRYFARDNWSSSIWKFLRIGYELSSLFSSIKYVNVSESGVLISYYDKTESTEKLKRFLIRNENDTNKFRTIIGDIALEVSALIFYSGDYFALSKQERLAHRQHYISQVTVANKSRDANDKTTNQSLA
ncbi:hypothetical protein PVAND_017608 [Polypedilum vanderplanki]|uniref:Uncharacterized protein n=1 Tax=Polypedilum vanderplanki TaxID=319348 RepID=A0A9J6B978_POLVA|nr:hypothetical protein PVAND_017608 [Polypedilum vanderplanki]